MSGIPLQDATTGRRLSVSVTSPMAPPRTSASSDTENMLMFLHSLCGCSCPITTQHRLARTNQVKGGEDAENYIHAVTST